MSDDMDKLVHENTYYEVILVAQQNREVCVDAHGSTVAGNYEVRNRQYGTTEYRCDNQPSALSVAEHYNAILDKRIYMVDDDDEGVFVDLTTKFSSNDDGDGGLH